MSKTKENLASAFAGESQANRKYLAYAKKAHEQGMEGITKIFMVAAEGETVHAHNHLKNLEGEKDTVDNIKSAVAGETYEIDKMYPDFIDAAQEEGEKKAEISFQWAMKVERIHQGMFRDALSKIETGETIEDGKYYICPVCGYPEKDKAPEICPVCGTRGEIFKLLA